jgi:S1-C subfamily serine protease
MWAMVTTIEVYPRFRGTITPVNLLDLGILALLILAVYNGYRRGAALQLCAYAGLILGLLVGALIAPPLAGLANSPLGQATVALIVLFTAAALGDALGWFVGLRIWSIARRSVIGTFDSVAGSLVALIALLLATWFIALNLANGPFPALSSEIRGSAIIRGLDQALPRPPSILGEVRQFLNRFGFPEVFADLPPAPAGPVKGPSNKEVKAIADLSDQSTLRIEGEACGAIQEGSGFVAAGHYVITNAHVVAGVKQGLAVQEQNGPSHTSVTVVLFDPKLDIAVLYVGDLSLPVLKLDSKLEDRGTDGAFLGYPGGGPLTYGPAAVRRELTAIGRDIYGRAIVSRDVYELQAKVRPGNSGGPFVLSDGEVAGVVFAASTTDDQVGYAISSTEVISKLHDAEGKTAAVSTKGCAR